MLYLQHWQGVTDPQIAAAEGPLISESNTQNTKAGNQKTVERKYYHRITKH